VESIGNFLNKYNEDEILQAEILMKYEGYLEKEQLMVEKMNRLENVNIKEDFDFSTIHNLSSEAKQKLNKQKPRTLGQAARISGISPSDISVLMIHLGR
jgi:tRNA uridine 5-carboxymethylaminomethyl modification enzyme